MHIHVAVSGDAQANIVGQGVQHIAGEQPTRATADVEQIAEVEAAAGMVFVGRDVQVDLLLGLLGPAGSGPVTTVVSGMGGVGKTTLARRAAQTAVGQGWFPGGALLVDLHGYDPDPAARVEAGQMFRPLLRDLGVSVDDIPVRVDDQAAVYHRRLAALAETGLPVLLVLDNTSESRQVQAVLPRHRVHRVLVTSRHRLTALEGARLVGLDILAETSSVDLIDQVVRLQDPDDDRVTAHRDDAVEVARACGRLPLALQITAGHLAADPHMTVAHLASDLADATTRLGHLADTERSVTAALDLSWHHLNQRDTAAARLFRLLPVNPGPDLATGTAAVLADLSDAQALPLLRALRHAYLIEPSTTPGRWRMHDLVRLYATALPGERDTATRRLLRHYTTTTDAADEHMRALPGEPVPDRFTDRADALAWLDVERGNLIAAVDLAVATGDHHTTLRLATALGEYLSWRRHLDDWVTTATAGLHAAQHLGSRPHEGMAWNNLGMTLSEVRRFDEAINAHHTAIGIFRETGNRHQEASAWNNLSAALAEMGKFDQAITVYRTVVGLYQQTGDRHREGMAWNNLGVVLARASMPDDAITAVEHAGKIYRETRDRHREGSVWNNLGLVLAEVGKLDQAIDAHHTAIGIFRETWDRHGEAKAWNNLGLALAEVGKLDQAITALERAVDAFTESGASQDADDARCSIQAIEKCPAAPSPDHRRRP